MSHLVDEERDDKRGDDDKHPADATQHVGRLVAQASCRLVDVGHEEAHDGGHEVPCQVDGGQEGNGLDSRLVGEQQLDVVNDAATLVLSLLGCKLGTLLELALQCPSHEGYDEQREEDNTRREDFDSSLCRISTDNGVSQRLDRTIEQSTGSEQHTEEENEHRTKSPRHLRDADVTTTVVYLRRLRDVRPRGRNTNAYANARDKETAQQHGIAARQHDDEHAQHVDQQVVGEDELTSEFVSQETTDDGTDGCAQSVGTEGVEPAQVHLRQSQIVLPQGDTTGTGDNGASIQVIIERHRQGALQGRLLCHFSLFRIF